MAPRISIANDDGLVPSEYAFMLDLERPIYIGKDWRKKQELIEKLPPYLYRPREEVLDYYRERARLVNVEKVAPSKIAKHLSLPENLAAAVHAHLKADLVAFLSFFHPLVDRDTRRHRINRMTHAQKVIAWRVAVTKHYERPVRVVQLKQRRGGFSFIYEGIAAHDYLFRENVGGLAVAHEVGAAKEILKYARNTYEAMPREFRPAQSTRTQSRLWFDTNEKQKEEGEYGLDSGVQVETMKKDTVGSGVDAQVFHGAEAGKWHLVNADPNVPFTSITNTIPEAPGTCVLLESTAHGAGTFFHEQWASAAKMGTAKAQEWSGYTPIFIPWFFDDRNTERVPDDMDWGASDDSQFGNEVAEMERYDLTPEQMMWRRTYINKQSGGNPARKLANFRQEYPANPREAWIFSRGKYLDAATIQFLEDRVKDAPKPKFFGIIRANREKGRDASLAEWTEPATEYHDFRILFRPQRGASYIVGADVAEGSNTGDFSCAKVYRRELKEPLQLVASYYGHCFVDDFADILWRLGHYYNDALLAWERTGSGQNIGRWLQRSRHNPRISDPYPMHRMFRQIDRSTSGKQKADRKFGIPTTKHNKKAILENWISMVREGADVDLETVVEASELEESLLPSGETRVATGGKDHFMASAMAFWAHVHHPIVEGRKRRKERRPSMGDVAWVDQMYAEAKKRERSSLMGDFESREL